MRTHLVLITAVLVAACASATPLELEKARSAYDRASHGPASELAPADVHSAHEQLRLAEQSFDKNGDSPDTTDLAYAARRKAELAEVRAQAVAAEKEEATARMEDAQIKEQQVRLTSAELTSTRAALVAQGQQLATAEREKGEAEHRAQLAAADLARIASVKQETRGLVITLSGAVLFASAQSDLLAQAQAKLSQVADVLTKQDKDSTIRVEGFTDSQGSANFNRDLSQRRAEAVRTYLVAHGIAADRITADGMGPANPVADNATAEGRADNRRVEIVVQPKGGASSTTP